MSRRLLIIGLDGATFDILDPLMEEGRMPNLRQLVQEGIRSDLMSTVPPVTPAAWTSFMTGKSPQNHGIFHFREFDPLTGQERINNSTSIVDTTIWEYLSEGGITVGVINLPMTFPPPRVEGFLVSGVDTPSLRAEYTWPAQLKDEITSLIPNYGLLPSLSYDTRSDSDFRSKIQRAIDYVDMRYRLASHLMREKKWDVFAVHFQTIDKVQHVFWQYIDPQEQVLYAPHRRSTVQEFYTYLDQCVGRLVDQAGKHCDLIILSDHGFRPLYAFVYPNFLLREWGYLAVRDHDAAQRAGPRPLASIKQHRIMRLLQAGWRQLRDLSSETEDRWIDRFRESPLLSELPIDFARTLAYMPFPTNITGFIFLNRQGDFAGILSEAEYPGVRQELKAAFQKVQDPFSGRPIFRNVLEGEAVYGSARADLRIPDLVLFTERGYAVKHDLNVGTYFRAGAPAGTGTHDMTGVLIARGPSFTVDEPAELPQIVDLAPTILALLGQAVPRGLDGRVLEEILREDIRRQVTYTDPLGGAAREQHLYSEDEEKAIEDRLRGLGYF